MPRILSISTSGGSANAVALGSGPVLEYRASDKPRVIDRNGRVIGSFVRVDEYGSAWDIEVNFQGLADTYTLTILSISYGPLTPDSYYANIAYFGDACEDRFTPMALPNYDGNFDKTRVYMRSPLKLYIPDPDGSFISRAYRRLWESYAFNCYENRNAEQKQRVFPLAATNLELQFPLTVKDTDIVIFQDLQLVF